jgi:GT2 family glycosyltransferase
VRIAVAVVAYNSRAEIERCLSAILAQLPDGGEVLVVDNQSTDGTLDLLRARYGDHPQVSLIASPRNGGFGAGNNLAIARTTADLVLLVNPDCELEQGAIDALQRFMTAHPRAAVAGGRLRYPDGAFQHSAFRFPTLVQVLLDYFPINWRLTESALNGRYPRNLDRGSFPCDFPLGALMCVRRAAIDHVGSFDEGFFMYVEEVDWCYRFRRAGWEVWHCGEAGAIHHGGRSTRQMAGAMFVELHRSRLRFYQKHYSRAFVWAARIIVAAGALKLAAADWLAQLRQGPSAERAAHARACLELLRL